MCRSERVQGVGQSMRSRYARQAATKSPIASPPNFSCAARASSQATAASATTASASTAATSERSTSACGRLAGREVDRAERLHQRRQRLHRRADDDLLAVREPPSSPPAWFVVAAAVGADLVVRLRAELVGEREALADLDALHGLDAHHRSGEPRVEAVLLRRVACRGRAARPRARTSTMPPTVSRSGARLVDRARAVPPRRRSRPATSMPIVASSAFATTPAATCTAVWRADARSSELRTSSWSYLRTPGEVGMAGPRQRDRLRPLALRLALGRPRAHAPRPVLVVDVADDERERRAERPAVAQAGEHLDAVLLDLLPRRAAVALLAALEVGVDRVAVELEPGREAGEDRDERGPVRLPGGGETKRHGLRA